MPQEKYKYVATRPLPVSARQRLGPRRWAYHPPVRGRSTMGTVIRRLVVVLIVLLAGLLAAFFAYKVWVDNRAQALIYAYNAASLPQNHVGLVFGAGLNGQGGPSAILYDRVATAADLY